MGAFLTPSRVAALQTRAERIVVLVKPWTFLWPPVAFAAGLGSFFLVDRQQWLGAALALGLLFAWALMLSESLLSRILRKRGQEGLPRMVTTFILAARQMLDIGTFGRPASENPRKMD